jgi:hypothetical protein
MSRQAVFILLLFLFQIHGFAQDSIGISYAKRISPDDFRPFMEVLTSDSLEGRETGRPGQKKAAAYIETHFRSLSLMPASHGGFVQHTPLSARANGSRNFKVNEKNFVYMRDYFYPQNFKDTTYLFQKILFAGFGISNEKYDDYKKIKQAGGIVMFFEGIPTMKKRDSAIEGSASISEKVKTAAAHGAKLVFVITDSLDNIIERTLYERPPDRVRFLSEIPVVYITPEMSKAIFPEAQKQDYETAVRKATQKGKPSNMILVTDLQLNFVSNTNGIMGENVAGLLEGTDKKNEVIVLTAHYDHLGIRDSLLYPGADDDASGTSAVMEMAKIFSAAAAEGHRPRRSILFMTVSGEEKGLLGSRYYVKRPVIPLEHTMVNLNTDMIGRTDDKHDSLGVRDYVYIIGSDKLSTTLHAINEKVNASFTKLELDYTYNKPDDPNRYYYRSDHYNFAKNNIPVIFYFNGSHADYHRPSDTIDKIQFDLLAKRTQLIFLTAWELANREEKITVDVVSDMPNKKEE